MAIFPLILHVQQRTGSAFAVSALIFALWGPVVLAAGLAGTIVDRFENRRILIAVSLAQAAVVAGMLAGVDRLWALSVGALGARAALLAAGLGPAAIGTACLLLLITRRRAATAPTTNEGRVLHARVQG